MNRFFPLAPWLALCLLSGGGARAQQAQPLPLEDLQVFAEVFGKIKSQYVDEVDDVTLIRNAIEGMLSGLDPHSVFLDPEDFEEIMISTDGKFGGLGIEVTIESGLIKVVSPIDGAPAHTAGIRSGDLILELDDTPVRGMNLRQVVERMRGPPGSEIKLKVSRQGQGRPLEFNLVRAVIKLPSVRGEVLEGGFGYVRVSSFQNRTGQSLRTRINAMLDEHGGPLNGLILDLRNNPGGVLTGAVEVSDLFIDDGEIVSTRGRNAGEVQSFTARPDDVISDAPMVVLVNGGSASASEIVAGALQDHRRATILGERTFGKGSVQTVVPMNNGGALKLTTARYYTPNNTSIQARGIQPDVVAEQRDPPAGGDEDEAGADSATSKLLEGDYQLKEALDLLKDRSGARQRQDSPNG